MDKDTTDNGVIALDVALLPPAAVAARLLEIQESLTPPTGDPADRFRFDATHLPHLTLVQQGVRRGTLEAMTAAIAAIAVTTPALVLRAGQIHHPGTTAHLVVAGEPPLKEFHERLLAALEPFATGPVTASSFVEDDELARPSDVAWVTRFRTESSGTRFEPHLTVGVGRPTLPFHPFSFRMDRLALCQLGRFCTCRTVLTTWQLDHGEQG